MAGSGAVNGGTDPAGAAGSSDGSAPLDDWYPCDGDPSAYDTTATETDGTWTVQHGGSTQTTSDMAEALTMAYGSLSPGRRSKESILVQGAGEIDANAQVRIPGYTVINLCGTVHVTGTASSADRSPLYARGASDIDVPHAHVTGSPQYGLFFREVSRLRLGQIRLELDVETSGLGIRIDNNPGAGGERVTDVRIDTVTVTSGGHGVETYGVDGLSVGRVEGKDTGNCGLILNDTVNAEVGSVHCENCAHVGTGYAAFRIANDAGKIGDAWPAGNIHVGEVYARGGGRGIFSVSGSGGLTIDRVDIADTTNNAILLQNCYNTIISAESGVVSGNSILLSNDTENTDNGRFEPSRNVTLQNLTLSSGTTVSEAWCQLGDRGNRARNITGGAVNMCFED